MQLRRNVDFTSSKQVVEPSTANLTQAKQVELIEYAVSFFKTQLES